MGLRNSSGPVPASFIKHIFCFLKTPRIYLFEIGSKRFEAQSGPFCGDAGLRSISGATGCSAVRKPFLPLFVGVLFHFQSERIN